MGIDEQNSGSYKINDFTSIPPETLKAALELWSQAGESHYIPLRGTSMLPLLRDGDQVLVSHSLDTVRSGDIVVFQRDDGLVAHRVLLVGTGSSGRMMRTKGDHALGLDPRLTEEQLIGRVLAIKRDDRLMHIDTPAWRASSKLVTGVMRAQVWLYHRAGRVGNESPPRITIILSRGVLWLGTALLHIFQAVLGRWQPVGEIIAS